MIRRFYILPLKSGVGADRLEAFLKTLSDADRFIAGLIDSSAGLDFDSRTVLWENTFVDEETYTGPYMVHPYHCGAIDSFVMADSPECVTHDIYTTRYELPDRLPRFEKGIRRVVMLNIPEGADTTALEALAGRSDGMERSVFRPDTVAWRSAKGLSWSHIWEQGFHDREALDRYLLTRDGIAGSSLEGFKRLGAEVTSMKILTCPFELKPPQSPAALPADTAPTCYTITARTAREDADQYISLLESLYDPSVTDAGGTLVHRWRSVDNSLDEVEVQSAWELDSVAAYSDVRAGTYADPRWNRFIAEAMPLVKGGTRRFFLAVACGARSIRA